MPSFHVDFHDHPHILQIVHAENAVEKSVQHLVVGHEIEILFPFKTPQAEIGLRIARHFLFPVGVLHLDAVTRQDVVVARAEHEDACRRARIKQETPLLTVDEGFHHGHVVFEGQRNRVGQFF